MSISQARVYISETKHDTLFETNFRIYTVQITGKCICETPPLFALLVPPHVEQPPISLTKKVCPL